MSLLQVSLNNLKELDMGKVSLALDEHIKRAARDCYDRPNDKKARKVVLQINIIPVCHDDGTCIELAGTLEPRELLERVRRVQFENGSLTTGKVERGQESLGRSITNKVQSEMGEIPEEVTLTLPVYKTKGEKELYGLRCSVEVDPAMGTFQLLPLPDQIERVQQNAVESIGERLGAGLSEGIPAYYGSA